MTEDKDKKMVDDETLRDIPETETPKDGDPADAEEAKEPTIEEKLTAAETRIAELEKDRLYKQAEFDNYRKNMMKDKADLILNGGRKVLETMLPVMDDLELALQHISETNDIEALREGIELIHKKFLDVLKSHGVAQIVTLDKDFNTDFHEAIAQIPSTSDEMKGKVIDCTKKGYTMNDKVLRFAQVVVGV